MLDRQMLLWFTYTISWNPSILSKRLNNSVVHSQFHRSKMFTNTSFFEGVSWSAARVLHLTSVGNSLLPFQVLLHWSGPRIMPDVAVYSLSNTKWWFCRSSPACWHCARSGSTLRQCQSLWWYSMCFFKVSSAGISSVNCRRVVEAFQKLVGLTWLDNSSTML